MKDRLWRLWGKELGQDLLKYALLIGLIALMVAVVVIAAAAWAGVSVSVAVQHLITVWGLYWTLAALGVTIIVLMILVVGTYRSAS